MRQVLTIYFLFLIIPLYAQVYNYQSFAYTNIEINPSFAASDQNKLLIHTSHLNNFQFDNSFSLNTIRVSKYFDCIFSGFGIVLSNSNLSDSIRYRYAGLSIAYRTIFLNKMYLRIGLNYKFLSINAPFGYFNKYEFFGSNTTQQNLNQQKANISLTVAGGKDKLYATFGILNLSPIWQTNENEKIVFPRYTYLKVGNLFNITGRGDPRKELSLLLTREDILFLDVSYGFYAAFFYSMTLNRRSFIRLGGNLGYEKECFINIKPSAMYYRMLDRLREKWRNYRTKYSYLIFKCSSDIGIGVNNRYDNYQPVYEFSVNLSL